MIQNNTLLIGAKVFDLDVFIVTAAVPFTIVKPFVIITSFSCLIDVK